MPTAAWNDLAPGQGEPDWAPLAREFSECKRTLILRIPSWASYIASQQPLVWDSIPYRSNEQPANTRGIYAFVLLADQHSPSPIPPHSCVLYVGETGNTGNATLISRLRSYRNIKSQRERPRVFQMLQTWGDYLMFYYASVNAGISTKDCEAELLDSLLPPVNNKDFSAIVANARNAALSQ